MLDRMSNDSGSSNASPYDDSKPAITLCRLKNGMISFAPMNQVGLRFLMYVFEPKMYEGANLIMSQKNFYDLVLNSLG